jgi:hypothetical protein
MIIYVRMYVTETNFLLSLLTGLPGIMVITVTKHL